MIKLCYIEYECKMTLTSMKKFKAATGQDLWHILIQFIEIYGKTGGMNIISRMRELLGICDLETASHVFNCIIVNDDKSVSLDDIQDGMFRAGWMPNEREDSQKSEPWPLVLVGAALEISKQFEEMDLPDKKKVDTSD